MDTFSHVMRGLIGIVAFVGLAVLLSENRRAIKWPIVIMGLVLQFTFAAMVIYVGPVRAVVE